MNTFGFEIEDETALVITLTCDVDGDNFTLALDTGASNTILDLAADITLGPQTRFTGH